LFLIRKRRGVGFFSGLLPVYITSLCKLGRQKIFWYVAKTPENNKPLFVGCLKKSVSYFPLNHPQTSRHCGMTASRLRCRRVRDLMSLLHFIFACQTEAFFSCFGLCGPNFPKAAKQVFSGEG
jgi:hypothetical protein